MVNSSDELDNEFKIGEKNINAESFVMKTVNIL
jgi:hypothetical protein